MKRIKAILIKDFYSPDGALHAGEKVKIEHEHDGYSRVQNDMGKLFVVPSHILKEIAWLLGFFFIYYIYEKGYKLLHR